MQSLRSELEPADFVEAFFFQRGDCDAFFFADRRAAFEFLTPLPRFEVRGVEIHIRQYRCEYDGQCDVEGQEVFHARLDGGIGFRGNSWVASSAALLFRHTGDGEATYGSIWKNYFIYLKYWCVAHFVRIFQESRLIVSQWQFEVLKGNLSIPPQFDFLPIHERICIDYVCGLTRADVFFAVTYF